jgi:hypothetical protein
MSFGTQKQNGWIFSVIWFFSACLIHFDTWLVCFMWDLPSLPGHKEPCARGMVSNKFGSTSCVPCGVGEYQPLQAGNVAPLVALDVPYGEKKQINPLDTWMFRVSCGFTDCWATRSFFPWRFHRNYWPQIWSLSLQTLQTIAFIADFVHLDSWEKRAMHVSWVLQKHVTCIYPISHFLFSGMELTWTNHSHHFFLDVFLSW